MKLHRSLLLLLVVILPLCVVHAQESPNLYGCLSQDASGTLHFLAEPSGRTYQVQGDMALLQRHIHEQVAITGPRANVVAPTLTVLQLRVLSQSCTSVLPSNDTFQVPGKTGQVESATPVTSVGSANETTPGFQTESGQQQAEHPGASSTNRNTGTAFGPVHPEQAGQSEFAADIDAQAASRAEMYPGTTLGVDIKTAPQSSVQASKQPTPAEAGTPK